MLLMNVSSWGLYGLRLKWAPAWMADSLHHQWMLGSEKLDGRGV